MKFARMLRVMLVAGAVVACAGLLGACSDKGNGIAAVVDGTEITEQAVTDRIQKYRAEQGLYDDDAWGLFLAQQGLTPEDMRTQYVQVLVGEKVLCDYAYDLDINIEDSEVNEAVDNFKANYSSEDTWEKALKQSGFTDDSYFSTIKLSITERKVLDHFVNEMEVTEDDFMDAVKNYIPLFDGAKRSSHILFRVENPNDAEAVAAAQQKASEVLARINDGSLDFADAAYQYSDDSSGENGGDVGWDVLNSFVPEYTDALSNLGLNQVSGLVQSDYGIHIIKVTDVFTSPDFDNLKEDDAVPTEFLEKVAEAAAQMKAITLTQEWLKEMKEQADITIYDMPKGLVYDIDMGKFSGITPITSTTGGDDSDEEDSAGLSGDLQFDNLELDAEVGEPLSIMPEEKN